MFSEKDLIQLKERGIEPDTVLQQIEHFKKGFPFADLVAPATIGSGIMKFNDEEIAELESYFEQACQNLEMLKFVPASGAATRMFKHLFEFKEKFDGSEAALQDFEKDKSFNSVYNFISRIHDFAFAGLLDVKLRAKGSSLNEALEKKAYNLIISGVLDSWGLDYANLPKGLILFHKYPEGPRTSVEEHLVEGALHARNSNNEVRIHFTVSPEHKSKFEALISEKKPFFEKKLGVRYRIDYSIQKPSTDTLAVDMNNEPFRNADGSLLFRPGGHGALLENLNEAGGDIIFIKNIDNIIGDRLRSETIKYKKVIGGLLLKIRHRVNEFLFQLDAGGAQASMIADMETYARTQLFINIPEEYHHLSLNEKGQWWKHRLNRPIRVCGMVKNEGEPGGGPFIVRNSNGEISLQIVESSQINLKDPSQKAIVDQATHFNPVDLVCSIKDYRGRRFHLPDFVDPETGFISIKSKDGRDLKALELPGLWNGAMANWLTVFVETPLITFNPVKTVNDLLRPEHQ
ncbi:MAG: hypothetical protein PWP35_2181 [Bacteroidales bacterium]|nr:hypothetical protein [Bacteroidales bacterium]